MKKQIYLILIGLLLILSPVAANASTGASISEAAYETWKNANYGETEAPVDFSETEMEINGYNKRATIMESDLYLPGKNGLDVNILREYDSQHDITYDTAASESNELTKVLRARYVRSNGATRYIDFTCEDEMIMAEAEGVKVTFSSTYTMYNRIKSSTGTLVTRDETYEPQWISVYFTDRRSYFDIDVKGGVEIMNNWHLPVPNLVHMFSTTDSFTGTISLYSELFIPDVGSYSIVQRYESSSGSIYQYEATFPDGMDLKMIYPCVGATVGNRLDSEKGISYQYIIQDKNGVKYYFKNVGTLTYIEDRYGNGIKYSITDSDFEITDTYGRIISYIPGSGEELGKLAVTIDGITRDMIMYELETELPVDGDDFEYYNKYHLKVKKTENGEPFDECENVTTYTMVKRVNLKDYSTEDYYKYTYPTMLIERITLPDESAKLYTFDREEELTGVYVYSSSESRESTDEILEHNDYEYESAPLYGKYSFVKSRGTLTTTMFYNGSHRLIYSEDVGDGVKQQKRYVYAKNKSNDQKLSKKIMTTYTQIFNPYSEDNYDYIEVVTNYKTDDRENTIYENYMGRETFYDYGTEETNPYNIMLSKTYENDGQKIKIENTLTGDLKSIAEVKEYVFENEAWVEKSHTSYEYDTYGNVVKETLRPSDSETIEKHYAYTYGNDYGDTGYTIESYQYTENNVKISNYSYFDRWGRLVKTIDGNGNETEYAYDDLSRLKTVTNSDNTSKEYYYDVTTNTVTATNENGAVFEQTYDMFGREKETYILYADMVLLQSKTYDPTTGQIKSIMELGAGNREILTEYTWDDAGRVKTKVVKQKNDNGTYTEVDRETNVYTAIAETATRIRNGTSTSQTKSQVTWQYGSKYEWNAETTKTATKTYNLNGLYDYVICNFQTESSLVEVRLHTDADTYTLFDFEKNFPTEQKAYRSYVIDVRGLSKIVVKSSTSSKPLKTYNFRAYTKEDIDNLVSKVTTTKSGDDSITPPKVEQTFDFWGNLISKKYIDAGTNNVLRQEKWTYDDMGNNLSYRNPQAFLLGIDSYLKEYDYAGRVVKETVYDEVNGASVTENGYDKIGRPLSVTDPEGNVTQTAYDNFSRIVNVTHPVDGNIVAETKYTYDNNGNVTVMEVKNGSAYDKTEYAYDNRNRVSYVTSYKDSLYTIPEVTQYTYDGVGNVLSMYTGLSGPLEQNELDGEEYSVVYYDYDDMNNLVYYKDADNKIETYTNDYLGNPLVHNNKVSTITYTYNRFGQPLSITPTNTAEAVTYEYDILGNRTKMTDETGVTEYTYSDFSELLTESKGTITKTYTYDVNGNRTGFTLADGDTVLLSNVYTVTSSGLLTGGQSGTDTVGYTYDKNRNMLTESINNALTHTNTYNNANQIKSVVNNYGTQQQSAFSYDYASTGNITSVTETLAGIAKQKSYAYDSIGRLTSETTETNATGYTYDLRGNRASKTKNSQTKSYTYSIDNRILESAGTDSQDLYYYTSGNLMYIDGEYFPNYDSYELLWSYDSFKRPSSAERYVMYETTTEYNLLSYEYDGDGKRVSKKIDNVVTEFVWDGDNIVMEKTGNDITVYMRGIRLFASDKNGTKTYYNYNGHGDVTQLVNAEGTITKTYEYDAFGNELNPDNADTNPFRYCAEYYDNETRYIYLRARYYSPRAGRFITEDPVRDGLNWYVYANNNPLKYIDPSGLRSKEAADKIIKDNATYIISAAEEFGVNPGILAATIYAEQRLNVDWKDDYIDGIVGFYGVDTSIGIGQLRISTAKFIEKEGYMPTLSAKDGGWNIPLIGFVHGTEQMVREKTLENSELNIKYAAGYLKYFQDEWKNVYPDIDGKTDILATLYNLGHEQTSPNSNPKPNDFGKFAKENYSHVRKLLGLE